MVNETENWVAMGYIKGAFGIKGWVKIKADTEYTDSLLDYADWRLRKQNHILNVSLEEGKAVGDELQVKFSEISDRDAAASLRGYTIEIPRESFASAEEGEYYWTDLVGMQVINRSGELIGEVSNLMETGAHDVLIINGASGQKLIPFVAHFIDDVDNDKKVITVDWGLDY